MKIRDDLIERYRDLVLDRLNCAGRNTRQWDGLERAKVKRGCVYVKRVEHTFRWTLAISFLYDEHVGWFAVCYCEFNTDEAPVRKALADSSGNTASESDLT
jgi:hypothetical protein